jgi:hypothetical protein
MAFQEKGHVLFVLTYQVQEMGYLGRVRGLLSPESHLYRLTVQAEAKTDPG